MNEPSFLDYIVAVAHAADDPRTKEWRVGQTYFNVLSDIRPDLAELIRMSSRDPFNMDARIPGFLSWVGMVWDEPRD